MSDDSRSKTVMLTLRAPPGLVATIKAFAHYKDWTQNKCLIRVLQAGLEKEWDDLIDPEKTTEHEYRKAQNFIKAIDAYTKKFIKPHYEPHQ